MYLIRLLNSVCDNEYMKMIYFNWGLKNEYVNDYSCYEYNLISSENIVLSCIDLVFFFSFYFYYCLFK